jgi:hypothetical protein
MKTLNPSIHCKRVRRLAGLMRREIVRLRGAVSGEHLLEAQTHLLSLTCAINRAEMLPREESLTAEWSSPGPRRRGASVPAGAAAAVAQDTFNTPDRKRLAANDND